MSDEIDPEIAALLGNIEEYTPQKTASQKAANPDFSTLFGEMTISGEVRERTENGVDLGKKRIEPVTKLEADKPATHFSDPDYYKAVLANEGEESQRVHTVLTKFIQATDPQDRGMYRQNLTPAYWNLFGRIGAKLISGNVPIQKIMMMRFGVLHPSMLSDEIKSDLHRVIVAKNIDEPVFYTDEWLKNVTLGEISPSSSDDLVYEKRDDRSRFSSIMQKAVGKRENAEGIMKTKSDERKSLESLLIEKVEQITTHTSVPGFLHVPSLYSDSQKKMMGELQEIHRQMLAVDKELQLTIRDFESASEEFKQVKEKLDALGANTKADLAAYQQEFSTVKNMAKLCVGRQGNHFPLLTKEYYHGGLRDLGTRENVLKWLAWLETVDIEVFFRPYKTTINRIVPYVILVPCYGDTGVCWEPFDIHNRATSRGRIAIPMYSKNLQFAILTAIADLRWTTAKEKASYYWMEEGLTGNYYQWYLSKKIKGDIKELFIQDYCTWILKEAEGIQKLDKEVRAQFWRYMPFPQEIKEKLKIRSPVYNDLLLKDQNRQLSQGY